MHRSLIVVALLAVVVAIAAAGGSAGTTGVGTVFLPNPVADLQDQSLTDQKDADYPALSPAYHQVTLTNLNGSGYLVGDWATVRSSTGPLAFSATNEFNYRRNDDRFEQVMAYYWVTESQKYIQSLGFGVTRRAVNKQSQPVRINQWGADNSFAWDKKNLLKFGKGGVDDAEDAEVILHEYGHAMHFSQNFSFATREAGAISEGFADYWAVTVSNVIAPTPDAPCVADWDSVSYTTTVPHCLRRTDLNMHYPEDFDPDRIHRSGQIWSRALWDIRQALGNVKADTLVIEGQFDFPGTNMPDLARSTVSAAERLYGSNTARVVRGAFEDRGIL